MRKGFTIHHDQNDRAVFRPGQGHERCIQFWGGVRDWHVNHNGWSDIAYSFGICPHGIRFEGRGWNRSQWANGADNVGPNDGGDAYWYTVLAFLGGPETPSFAMISGIHQLIAEGRSSGRCGLAVKPHNDFKVKPCPGPELTALARRWDGVPFSSEDEMSAEAEAAIARIDRFLFGGLTPEQVNAYIGGAHAVLNTNHFVTNVLPAAVAALDGDQDAQYEVLVSAIRSIEGGSSGATADQIIDKLKERL